METALQSIWNVQNLEEIQNFLGEFSQMMNTLKALPNPPEHWISQQNKIINDFEKVGEALLVYSQEYNLSASPDHSQFWTGYEIGQRCNHVLYDASQIPVQAVKTALAMDVKTNLVPAYLLGIQVGWRVASLQQNLSRFLPYRKTDSRL